MEKITDIDPDETERCMFMNAKCTVTMDRLIELTHETQLKWCQNCLMGKLIEELRRLRLTGLQP